MISLFVVLLIGSLGDKFFWKATPILTPKQEGRIGTQITGISTPKSNKEADTAINGICHSPFRHTTELEVPLEYLVPGTGWLHLHNNQQYPAEITFDCSPGTIKPKE